MATVSSRRLVTTRYIAVIRLLTLRGRGYALPVQRISVDRHSNVPPCASAVRAYPAMSRNKAAR
jgi:hypothetical protein